MRTPDHYYLFFATSVAVSITPSDCHERTGVCEVRAEGQHVGWIATGGMHCGWANGDGMGATYANARQAAYDLVKEWYRNQE